MTAVWKARAAAVLAGLVASVLVSGCASRTDTAGRHVSSVTVVARVSTAPTKGRAGSSTAAVPAVPPCRTQGSAFELSLVGGFRGAPDPVGAAQWFVRRGGVAGFGSSSSVWVLADPVQARRGEATLVDGTVSLHAVRMPNGTWAIDSGAHCV